MFGWGHQEHVRRYLASRLDIYKNVLCFALPHKTSGSRWDQWPCLAAARQALLNCKMRLDMNRFDYVAPDLSSPTHRDITLGWVDKYHITAYNFIALDSKDNQSFWHFIHFAPWGKEKKKWWRYWRFDPNLI